MTKRKRARYWVLRDGRNYFCQWVRIGPLSTLVRGDAERFKSKREAMQSDAYSFPLMSYEPEAVR